MMGLGKTLGVLGGMGPMASVYFYELLTVHTLAAQDQDHLDILLSSHPKTSDRTAFLLGKSETNPLASLQMQAERLEQFGADILAIACNTAHCFHKEISEVVSVPVLHMPRLTVEEIVRRGGEKVGIMATSGTVQTGLYQTECERANLAYAVPEKRTQEGLMQLIYEDIKASRPPRVALFSAAVEELLLAGCTHLVLGCTELSLLKREKLCPDICLDSMEALAKEAIVACGKIPQGFA